MRGKVLMSWGVLSRSGRLTYIQDCGVLYPKFQPGYRRVPLMIKVGHPKKKRHPKYRKF